MVDLTLCMIVKNEERRLTEFFESVRTLVDELVVVDTGSTDGTRQAAEARKARVFPFDFSRVDFAAARNHGLKQASGRWILVLDADETMDPSSLAEVRSIVARDGRDGYYVERQNQGSAEGMLTRDYAIRLFPNRSEYRYRGRVHETIDRSILAAGGKLMRSGICVQHGFAADADTRRHKHHWYLEILQQEFAADPTDTSRLDFMAAEYHQLEMYGDATRIAEQIAKLRPNDAQAHLFAGTYHLLFQPDFEQARSDFNEALRLRPNYPEAESFLRMLDEKERANAGWRAE